MADEKNREVLKYLFKECGFKQINFEKSSVKNRRLISIL